MLVLHSDLRVLVDEVSIKMTQRKHYVAVDENLLSEQLVYAVGILHISK